MPLKLLGTMHPESGARCWQSVPHPSQPIVATACGDKTVRIYSLQTLQQQSVIEGGHKRSIRCCTWDKGAETKLATGSFDSTVGVWTRGVPDDDDDDDDDDIPEEEEDDDEWQFSVILESHESEVKSLAFCPVAPYLATASRDKTVIIWEDLGDENYELVDQLALHEGDVKCVAWHPYVILLASASYDDSIRLWAESDAEWGCVDTLLGHQGTVWWVEFEKKLEEDGEEARLLSASADGTVKLWRRVNGGGRDEEDVPSIWPRVGNEKWVEQSSLPKVHDGAVYAASWSGTGLVASAGADGRIVVYEEGDAKWSVKHVQEYAHDVYEINHITWARKDGNQVLVSSGDDGTVRVWGVT
ncbi:WD40 repeat-like protein [Piedraia hortae CBS 480.64]|uniref:Probable cytosolic iron-sulfur protein assembly protein 1 n=1 Tax=Piedraia hortae CBS 480.64 TaxID=1314780 RepID=A0A6A7C9V1_9PEZI|nr:WD40 repeat-like protein [Piedraia hortae CBS 480.64]